MNIEKAKEILTGYCSKDSRCYDPDLYDSIQLGIEALTRVEAYRNWGYQAAGEKLPSEIED